jgi:carboxylesterase type B
MLPCLQSKTAEDIYEAGSYAGSVLGGVAFCFLPVIDSQISDGVLPQEPINLIKNELYNKVPYINGLTENEGGLFAEGGVYDRDFITNELSILVAHYTALSGDELTEVTSLVYDLYFSDIDLDNDTAIGEGVQAYISDSLFNTANFLMMTLLPKGESYPATYSYVFTYRGQFMNDRDTGMTTHGDELPYIFDVQYDNNGILDAQDNITSDRILTLWTTFAKTGDPNPTSGDVISVTWEAVTSSDSIPYLQIDTELSMGEGFRRDRMEFWNSSIVPIVIPYY